MMTVPDSLLAAAGEVRAKRHELATHHSLLCTLNAELLARRCVAFTEPKADGFCVSYRPNPGTTIVGRGRCAPEDRERTTPPGMSQAPAELTERIEQAYYRWQSAASDAERAKLFFDAEGQAFLNEVLSKGGG